MKYRFADCVFDSKQHRLYRADQLIEVEPKAVDVLTYLLQRHGELVLREELLEYCWPGLYIAENSLTRCLSRVREAVGHSEKQKLIETVRGKGYRFVGDVVVQANESATVTGSEALSETLPESQPSTSADSVSITAERRQITVLCCRLAGEPVNGELDAEEYYHRQQQYRQLSQQCLTPLGGHLVQSLSHGFTAYFGYPQAFEDNAQRAVLAGLRFIGYWQQHEPASQETVHIGIHTGVEVIEAPDHKENPLSQMIGPAHHIAEQLSAQSDEGVIISASTAQLIEGYFEWQVLPPLTNAASSTERYRVISEKQREDNAGLTPFVGREAELGLLYERWQQVKEGRGQVAWIRGEAGIGKSRLAARMYEQIARESQSQSHLKLECQCSPYHQNTALFPLIELLRRVLQIQPAKSEAANAETANAETDVAKQIEALVERYSLPDAEAVSLLAGLLSVRLPPGRYPAPEPDVQQQRQQSLQLLLTMLLDEAQRQPLLLIIEDLHWADPSTLEFIALLIGQVSQVPMLVMLNSRSEFELVWQRPAPVMPLRLERLNRDQIDQLLWRFTAGKKFSAESKQQISEKTDGIPLFIEELTRMLLESGQLRETDQGIQLSAGFDLASVPVTLQDSLMARLDRLGPGKEIARRASVLGRKFSDELLKALMPNDAAALQSGLNALVAAGLVYRQGLAPNIHYLFKHALIRDAAYQSMLKRQRQEIHREVAKTLEAQFPAVVTEQPELIAQHYTQAEQPETAIPYWSSAGQRAAERWAHQEAVKHLDKGLELLTGLPDTAARSRQELELQINLGPSLAAVRGQAHAEVGQCLERARELCDQLGETTLAFPILSNLWRFNHSGARHRHAHQIGEALMSGSRQQNHPRLLQAAHQMLGTSLFFQGDLSAGIEHLQQSLSVAGQLKHVQADSRYSQDPRVMCLVYLIMPLWLTGYPDQARQRSRQLIALAEEIQHPFSLAFALHCLSMLHLNRLELQQAREYNDTMIELARQHRFAVYLALGEIVQGWFKIILEKTPQGLHEMRLGFEHYQQSGSMVALTMYQRLLVEAYKMMGRPDEGLNTLEEIFAFMEQSGERFIEAELHRLKGELLLLQNSAEIAAAEKCFQQSLEVARQQQAKWLELRTALSLAQLWQKQQKREQAVALLAPVYDWFSEGFDSAELQQAENLLQQLQPSEPRDQ